MPLSALQLLFLAADSDQYAAGESASQQGVCFASAQSGHLGGRHPAGHPKRQLYFPPGKSLPLTLLCLCRQPVSLTRDLGTGHGLDRRGADGPKLLQAVRAACDCCHRPHHWQCHAHLYRLCPSGKVSFSPLPHHCTTPAPDCRRKQGCPGSGWWRSWSRSWITTQSTRKPSAWEPPSTSASSCKPARQSPRQVS